MRSLPETIAGWVHDGFSLIGQIRITSRPGGSFEMRHREDVTVHGLEEFRGPSAARDLSFFDEARNYRPLKTAPNLRRGWSLIVETPEDLRLALDHFYPAMTALWRWTGKQACMPPASAFKMGKGFNLWLVPVTLRPVV